MMQDETLQKYRRREYSKQDRHASILSPGELHTTTANFGRLVEQFLTTQRSARVRAMHNLEQQAKDSSI